MVKSRNQKNKRKGNFLSPEIYNFAKSNEKKFINHTSNEFLNIRSSSYLKKFCDCIFKVHNGKYFVVNDPMELKSVFKVYPFYNFKIGQFSYNKQIIIRNWNRHGAKIIEEDLKKKKGIYIKNNKKKKFIYTDFDGTYS